MYQKLSNNLQSYDLYWEDSKPDTESPPTYISVHNRMLSFSLSFRLNKRVRAEF